MEVPETSGMSVVGVFALRKYCLDVARIGVREVEEALERAGISLVGSGLGVLVPPYVCGECFSKEVGILKSMDIEDLLVVAPESRADDLSREFASVPHLAVREYANSVVSGLPAASYDGVIYFRVSDSQVNGVYLSNSEAPEASEVFVARCKE